MGKDATRSKKSVESLFNILIIFTILIIIIWFGNFEINIKKDLKQIQVTQNQILLLVSKGYAEQEILTKHKTPKTKQEKLKTLEQKLETLLKAQKMGE